LQGIGRALAEKFLRLGDNVVICARSPDGVDAAVKEMAAKYGEDRVVGAACDVSSPDDLERLAKFAQDALGSIDVWINNAGTNAYSYGPLFEQDPAELRQICETNVLGIMLGCRQAIRTMKDQPGGGHIFNMDGAGADGSPTPRFAAYGSTKHAIVQLNESLAAELKSAGLDAKVQVHNLSPGMVTTELLMSGSDTTQARWFINCLAEETATVADFLVPKVRDVVTVLERAPLSQGLARKDIRFLTKLDAFKRIVTKAVLGKNKGRWVPEE